MGSGARWGWWGTAWLQHNGPSCSPVPGSRTTSFETVNRGKHARHCLTDLATLVTMAQGWTGTGWARYPGWGVGHSPGSRRLHTLRCTAAAPGCEPSTHIFHYLIECRGERKKYRRVRVPLIRWLLKRCHPFPCSLNFG